MSSNPDVETGGRPSAADASERPLSQNPDAVRKREARKQSSGKSSTTSGGRGGGRPTPDSPSKGNPLRPSEWSTLGEPLSPHEAERQLYWAHVGLAKAMRSEVDLSEMKEEFEVAGENYSFVANKMFPALRVMIRFVAPLVLAAVLVSIWVAIIAATPWWQRVGQWWRNRGQQEQQPPVNYETPPFEVVQQPPAPDTQQPQQQQSPPIPRRPAIVRRLVR